MNPFIYGEIVKYPDFCNRPVELNILRKNIESGYKSVLIGERRTGKTSLIFETARDIPGSHLLYAQFWAVRNLTDIVNRLLAGLSSYQSDNSFLEKIVRTLAHLKPEIGLNPDTGSPILSISAGTTIHTDTLSGIFAMFSQQTKKNQLIIAMDEFQDILRIDGADVILGELRGYIQQESRTPYIFAGSIRHDLEQIFLKPGAPFYKSVRTVEIGPLPDDSYTRYLMDRFDKGGRRVNNRIIEMIFDISQQNPGDIQQFCAAIWDITNRNDIVDEETLNRALHHIFASSRKGFENQVRLLTDPQLKTLRTLARIGGNSPQSKEFIQQSGIPLPATIKRSLDRLIKLEIIYGSEQNYRFFDPFFCKWVTTTI